MTQQDRCLRTGVWLYNGTVPCRVEIWRRNLKPGTGDYQDPPEISDEQVGEWYAVEYAAAGEDRVGQAGGGFFSTLDAALESVRASTNGAIQWDAL